MMNNAAGSVSISNPPHFRWLSRVHLGLTLLPYVFLATLLSFVIRVYDSLGYWPRQHEGLPFSHDVHLTLFIMLGFAMWLTPLLWIYILYKLWWDADYDLWGIVKRLLLWMGGYIAVWIVVTFEPFGFWNWFSNSILS